MTSDSPLHIALHFVELINKHDVRGLTNLMAEDHAFIDSLGAEVRGRKQMHEAWVAYFVMVPDYAVEVHETFVSGGIVVMLGKAGGTFSPDGTLKQENRWQIPAVFRAVVLNGRIKEWRVYADNEPVRALMAGKAPS